MIYRLREKYRKLQTALENMMNNKRFVSLSSQSEGSLNKDSLDFLNKRRRRIQELRVEKKLLLRIMKIVENKPFSPPEIQWIISEVKKEKPEFLGKASTEEEALYFTEIIRESFNGEFIALLKKYPVILHCKVQDSFYTVVRPNGKITTRKIKYGRKK